MNLGSPLRTLALIVGILLIVVGGGLVLQGLNEMQAADEWDGQMRYCGSGDPREVSCPSNPHSGGEGMMIIGSIVAIVGGYGTRFGVN